ncbi:MAG: hydrogenase maturation protease [Thermodesulfovibrionales bacterium]|nr:hydrogenase maturation protease [Thermodesulfovibrionales bacterium]
MKTVIIGLGNPVLGDDRVGIEVARLLRERLGDDENVTVKEQYAGGIRLLDELAGFERAIIVDSIVTGGKAGTVYRLGVSDLPGTRNTISTHDTNFRDALSLGEMIGLALPGFVTVFGIEAGNVETFSEDLTPEVKEAVPGAVELVLKELRDCKERQCA